MVFAAAAAALISAGGLVGSTFVQSPAQAAADTRAPKASLITAPVVSQVLTSTVVLRGSFADGKTVAASPTSVASTADNPGGSTAMVTQLFVKTGDQVNAGSPLVEYSGRPVFALPGSIPMYRDLTPGESGHDVQQLQTALAKLGHSSSPDQPGLFGSGTKHAVSELYKTMGYPVPVTGAATANAVRTAQQAVEQARSALKSAEHQGTTDQSGGTPALPSGSISPASAAGTLGSASPSPGAAPPPPKAVGPATDVTEPQKQLAQAEVALAQAEAVDGPMLPASECVYVPSLPARVVSLPLAVGDSVKGPIVTLARGDMELTGMLDPSQGSLVKPGMPVQITAEAKGLQATGTVDSVGSLVTPGNQPSSGTQPTSGQPTGDVPVPVNGGAAYLPLAVKPDRAWDTAWAGQDVRITITAATTSDPVLAVPEAAISAGANMHTSVTAVGPDGRQHGIDVTVGPSADGLVQVTPSSGGHLEAGDRVVVGQ
ncbi:peptidoglycan-binding protein [Kitasatospora acidiphila]|uniref:Peptidoglycan-binding protein n=1 Tax=Kitasatospora acidiphila TaxID=2567942 RepID=A0A540W4T5_9ACTN|nr:peptidoglycan-binding protein [Kitasatospora acidiphila]TQF04051.1 peptidoglycan-binding protein [Kitasatospora acidiphila]